MEENLKELRDSLVKYIDEAISKIGYTNTYKPYNGWYKSKAGAIVFFTGEISGYGVNRYGEWRNHYSKWLDLNLDLWKPATKEEVEDMLIKEAKKRGYEYNNFNCLNDNRVQFEDRNFYYSEFGRSGHGLKICDRWCFINGKWAEKILVEQKEKLPYNAWYKSKHGAIAFFQSESFGYGVNRYGEWKNNDWKWLDLLNFGMWNPATKEEVIEMFTTETKKRGYEYGVKLRYPWGSDSIIYTPTFSGDISYFSGNFSYYGTTVFNNGVWAEIVKEEEIEIGGYKVEFKNGIQRHKGFGGQPHFTINGVDYWKEDLIAAQKVIHCGGKIMVGCSHQYELTLETVEKILKKLQ